MTPSGVSVIPAPSVPEGEMREAIRWRREAISRWHWLMWCYVALGGAWTIVGMAVASDGATAAKWISIAFAAFSLFGAWFSRSRVALLQSHVDRLERGEAIWS